MTGIVWETHRENDRRCNRATDPQLTRMGIAVFDSYQSRDAAVALLREEGFRYWTTFNDAQGPGLSYAERMGGALAVRPSARKRVPALCRRSNLPPWKSVR